MTPIDASFVAALLFLQFVMIYILEKRADVLEKRIESLEKISVRSRWWSASNGDVPPGPRNSLQQMQRTEAR